ncbi:DUF4242 domain-containing protein [Oceanihabitans sp. 2_MG-2023]|uniref:DUF4242 domain-containing protein n=1 Tax=Oceanihabitans sp. 2_MG-2023 TaxID=3062661 RepID=UPI0026E3D83A|nr:DUF4242 domain-containing protein [Oceanihabitans sp. 2_MG-2023]MDO6598178.1 DUF4242 domain-containing protein [Oceanihabitans sp. 2_MG-2023]
MKTIKLILVLIVFTLNYTQAQEKENQTTIKNNGIMKTYVIERNIPGAGELTTEQLKGISQTSCSVLKEMGPKIEWQHSYVTGDKVYCVYKAENKALIEEHAKKGGFPANSISEVKTVISPATAEL